jgi:hypothetical protein
MKTASAQQVPQQWPEILRWVAAGEEVQVTQHDLAFPGATLFNPKNMWKQFAGK